MVKIKFGKTFDSDMTFKRLARILFQGESAVIAEQILERIKTGEFGVGDKLPPQ